MKNNIILLALYFLIVIIFGCIFFNILKTNNHELVCISNEANITLMYNKNTITGYKTNRVEYDLNNQKEIALELGLNKYLDEFKDWFENNTSGSCKRSK